MNAPQSFITAKRVQKAVATMFGTSIEAMLGNQRSRRIAQPRQIAMLLCRDLLPARSYPELARCFNRDHTTIMHGCIAAQSLLERDKRLSFRVAQLRSELCEEAGVSEIEQTAAQYAETVSDAFRRSVLQLARKDPEGFIRRALGIVPSCGGIAG